MTVPILLKILQGELRQYEYHLHNRRSWAFGMAFGAHRVDSTQGHAFNLFVDRQERVWLVEPQTNNISSVHEFSYGVDFYVL